MSIHIKGDTGEYSNCRGITQLSIVSTVYENITEKSIWLIIKAEMHEGQCNFRKKHPDSGFDDKSSKWNEQN